MKNWVLGILFGLAFIPTAYVVYGAGGGRYGAAEFFRRLPGNLFENGIMTGLAILFFVFAVGFIRAALKGSSPAKTH